MAGRPQHPSLMAQLTSWKLVNPSNLLITCDYLYPVTNDTFIVLVTVKEDIGLHFMPSFKSMRLEEHMVP